MRHTTEERAGKNKTRKTDGRIALICDKERQYERLISHPRCELSHHAASPACSAWARAHARYLDLLA